MAIDAFYPGFDVIRIDANGYRQIVPSRVLNVYNVTDAVSAGTLTTNVDGMIVEGGFDSTTVHDPGDVLEFSDATYPGKFRLTLQTTQLLAYTAAENDVTAFVVQNLYTPTTASSTAELFMVDTADPLAKPFKIGDVRAGVTNRIPFQTTISKSARFYLVSQDSKSQLTNTDFSQAATTTLTIPSTAAMDIGDAIGGAVAQRPLYVGAGNVLSQLTLTANQSLRMSSGGTSLEAFLPSTLIVGSAVSGGGANRVLYEDGSQNLAASANLTFTATGLAIGGGTASDILHLTTGKLRFTGTYAPSGDMYLKESAGALSIGATGVTPEFRLLPFGNDIYFQNTFATGSIRFTGPLGAATTGIASFLTAGLAIGDASAYGYMFYCSGSSLFNGDLQLSDAKNIIAGSTTGMKIGTATTQKLGIFNAAPIVQPTTAVAAAVFVANTSAVANDTATFDGYTIGQIVKALRNLGLLA